MYHPMEQVPTSTASLIAKKRSMQDALPVKNKTYMEIVKIRVLATKNVMEDQKSSLGNKFHFCRAKDKLKLLDRNDPQGN